MITTTIRTAVRTFLIMTSAWTLPTITTASFPEQHYESAPHRCAGCASGTCVPMSPHGYHSPQWRRWPGATDYVGFRRPVEQVDVPPVRIPDALNEGRIQPRTRSDRPLDDELDTASPAPTLVPEPDADDGASPFDNIVPNTELPEFGPGIDAPPLDGLDTPGTPDPADDLFNPFNDSLDSPLSPDEPAPIDLGGVPRRSGPVMTASAIRAIKNRELALQTGDELDTKKGSSSHVESASYEIDLARGKNARSVTGSAEALAADQTDGYVLLPIGGNPLRRRQMDARNIAARGVANSISTAADLAVESKSQLLSPEPAETTELGVGYTSPDWSHRSLRETLRRNPLR